MSTDKEFKVGDVVKLASDKNSCCVGKYARILNDKYFSSLKEFTISKKKLHKHSYITNVLNSDIEHIEFKIGEMVIPKSNEISYSKYKWSIFDIHLSDDCEEVILVVKNEYGTQLTGPMEDFIKKDLKEDMNTLSKYNKKIGDTVSISSEAKISLSIWGEKAKIAGYCDQGVICETINSINYLLPEDSITIKETGKNYGWMHWLNFKQHCDAEEIDKPKLEKECNDILMEFWKSFVPKHISNSKKINENYDVGKFFNYLDSCKMPGWDLIKSELRDQYLQSQAPTLSESQKAVYRVAARKLNKAAQKILLDVITQYTTSSSLSAVKTLLDTEYGYAFISYLVGNILQKNDNAQIQVVAEELRVDGLAISMEEIFLLFLNNLPNRECDLIIEPELINSEQENMDEEYISIQAKVNHV